MSSQFKSGLSRRSFLSNLAAASVAAGSLPAFAAVKGSAAPLRPGSSQNTNLSLLGGPFSDETVFISMNENPLGPAQSALDAIRDAAGIGNRYHGEITQATIGTALDLYGLRRGYIGLFPGSTGAINLALLSSIGPGKALIHGEPSYEQAPATADLAGASRFGVKLNAAHAHDVKAMVAATPHAGAYYIVNPNNPTGTMTPKSDIVWLLKNKPAGSVVIVDEAYHDFSNDESCIDLVAAEQDIIVTRTFSKIYGMAGIRAGLVFAKPEYFQRFRAAAPLAPSLASVSITSAAGANAALLDTDLVPLRRKINADIRSETLEFLTKRGYTILPGSQANFFMVDVKRPGGEFQSAMLEQNVAIGRTWSSMPTWVRVSVGTRDEMARFQSAFVKCMDVPSNAVDSAELRHSSALNASELHRGQQFFV